MKGLEERSSLRAIRGAIGPKFSDPNQRLTKYKRRELHNHASDCSSSSNVLIGDDVGPVYRRSTFFIIFVGDRHLRKHYSASDES